MSYITVNPSNQPIGLASGTSLSVTVNISGQQVVVNSGSALGVAIAGTVGGTTFADVQSSVGSDDVGTGTDALSTQSLVYGFHSGNQQWARIGAQIMASGGGFGLQTSTVIRDHNSPNNKARVFNDNALGIIDTTDDALLTVSELLGYDQSISGYRGLQVTSSGKGMSGINHKLAVAFSGDIMHIGDETSNNIVRAFAPDYDNGSPIDVSLMTIAQLYGYDSSLDQFARVRITSSGKGMSGIHHRLPVALSGDPVAISGQTIQLAGAGNTVDVNATADVTEPNTSNQIYAAAYNYGRLNDGTNQGALFAIAVSSGIDSSPGITVPSSGYFLGTTSMVIGRNGNIALVDDPDADDEGSTDSALHVKSFTYGYHDVNGDFTRVRNFALSSGQTQSFSTTLPFSGYVLGTAALLTDVGGRIANMGDTDDDAKGTIENAVDTNAILRGFDQVTNALVRIRATASGAAFSGIHHKLAVAFSGDIVQIGEGGQTVDVQSAGADTMSNSDNALTVVNRQMAYDQSGDQFRRVRGIGTQSGGIDFAMYVKPQEPQSFVAISRAAVATSGGHFMVIYHAGGADVVVKIKDIHIINDGVSPASGERFFFELAKFSFAPTGGTTTSATSLDPRNNLSGVALTIRLFPTNMSGNGMTVIRDLVTLTQGWETPTVSFNSGMTTLGIVPSLLQLANLAPHEHGTQPLTLTSGHGASIWQPVFYGVRTSGRFAFFVTYTVEPY